MSPADRRRPEPRAPIAFAPELMHAHAAEAAQLLKALGNEQRLHILCNLLDGPLSVGELNQRLELSQSALSQHLALLREMELVEEFPRIGSGKVDKARLRRRDGA